MVFRCQARMSVTQLWWQALSYTWCKMAPSVTQLSLMDSDWRCYHFPVQTPGPLCLGGVFHPHPNRYLVQFSCFLFGVCCMLEVSSTQSRASHSDICIHTYSPSVECLEEPQKFIACLKAALCMSGSCRCLCLIQTNSNILIQKTSTYDNLIIYQYGNSSQTMGM